MGADVSVQANSEQSLTMPSTTVEFTTPTLTFGEVGYVGEQVTEGYASHGHGVGEFEETRLLERAVQLDDISWTAASAANANIVIMDVDKALREYHRNARIFEQFSLYRADIEVEIKLNTNQFYYGILQVTLYPGTMPGINGVDRRAVLDPTLISAQVGDSVTKTWKYSWPMMWKPCRALSSGYIDTWPTTLAIDVLAPLKMAKQDMDDHITIKSWARFKNIKLCYPWMDITPEIKKKRKKKEKEKDKFVVQSAEFPVVKKPKKSKGTHPDDTPGHRNVSTVDTAVKAFSQITLGDAFEGVKDMAGEVGSLLGYFLDKPDVLDSQDSFNAEASIDLFNTDRPDTNVSVSVCRGRYVDPGAGRIPMSKDFTMSQYAQIPGQRATVNYFAAKGDTISYSLIQKHSTGSTKKIPLDYCWISSKYWRGSIKVLLVFVASSFVSARFVVQFINDSMYTNGFADPYDCGVSRVINVKGDTVTGITLPWMDMDWWREGASPKISITCDSDIATSDTVTDPQIGLLTWVAGGEDIQFAWPRIIQYGEWGPASSTFDEDRVQTAVGGCFKDKALFPAIVENCYGGHDDGWCTGEVIGSLAELAKRYTPVTNLNGLTSDQALLNGFRWGALDANPLFAYNAANFENLRFRSSFFGQIRSMFWARSGGYRWRHYSSASAKYQWVVTDDDGGTVPYGTQYHTGDDGVSRLTIPQVMPWPYEYLRDYSAPYPPTHGLSISAATATVPPSDNQNTVYLAARDDLQLGFPILPTNLTVPLSSERDGKKPSEGKTDKRLKMSRKGDTSTTDQK